MNIGIIGTGWVSTQHVEALNKIPEARVVGIAGRNTERAKELARMAVGGDEPKVWDDGITMVRQANLDAVLVLLPPHLHGELEREIARHVPAALIEKPVGIDLATTEGIAEAFERAGTLVSAGYMNRYRKTTAKVRDLFSSPDHRPVLINGWWVNETPPPLWWRRKDQSGGQFVEQCTHLVDLARWVAGEVTEVSAFSTRGFITELPGFTVDDALTVNLRFASGALGSFTTGCFPLGNPSTGRGTDGVGMTFSSRTTQCTLTGWAMDLDWKNNRGEGATQKSDEDIFAVQNRAFLEAARTGNRALIHSSYPDAVRTLRVTLAAERSAQTGTVVKIEE